MAKNLNKAGRSNDRVLTPETIWRPCLEALRIAAGDAEELFDLDPAGAPGQDDGFVREVLVPEHGRDGLAESWADKLVWFNGPYSQFQHPKRFPWFERAQEAAFTCAFMPARTAAGWWQDLALVSPMVLLLEGRVVHKNALLDKKGRPCGAPFAQCIMYFGEEAPWVPPPKMRGMRLDTVTRFR